MFRLTREVRFAINSSPDRQLAGQPSNSYGGFPSLTGLGHYFTLRLTLNGSPDPQSGYLRNIKEMDSIVRQRAIPVIEELVETGSRFDLAMLMMYEALGESLPETFDSFSLSLSPFQWWEIREQEHPMVRLSQKFEFSASHRLHNPALPADANLQTYGKCNNPNGHGHNYEVQVTLAGVPDASGVIVDVPAFERIVADVVIRKFDHKNLNVELEEFRTLIPTVENIAMTIYRLLKPHFAGKLASVTVWETPKTWCEYSEEGQGEGQRDEGRGQN